MCVFVGDVAGASLIRSGDMVVFFEGREAIGFDRMKTKSIWQCRHGAFHHDDIVGKPFGSRVSCRCLSLLSLYNHLQQS